MVNRKQTLNIQGLSRLNQDKCYRDLEHKTIVKKGNYMTLNYRKPLCQDNTILENSLNQPIIIHKDGHGWTSLNGCNIDIDSQFRNANNLTNLRCINQLNERMYSSTPYMGRGLGNINIESELLPGNNTYINRPCNKLSGINIDRFVPQVPNIKNTIQNTKYIIPEDSDKNWVRGGQPSRQVIKNN